MIDPNFMHSKDFPAFITLPVVHFPSWAKVLAFSFCSGLFLASCSGPTKAEGSKSGKPPVLQAEAVIVKPTTLRAMYQSSGTLMANEEINVYPEVAGRVTSIHFKEGGTVRKGDLLVQLFDDDVRAQIQKLKAQKQLQITTKNRQDELLAINGISRQEYDNTVTQIAAIDADIAYSEAQLRRLQIRAPFEGAIGLRNVSIGAIVNTGTLITRIQQVQPLKLDFAVPDQYKGILHPGNEVHFTINGIPDTLTARISALQPGAEASTRTVTIRAITPNPDRKLVPGAYANVYVSLQQDNKAITIPSQCIIPTTRDKKVAVLRAGKAELVTITTGLRMVERVEIINGLTPGDTVLTTGIMQVKPGMDVSITKINN